MSFVGIRYFFERLFIGGRTRLLAERQDELSNWLMENTARLDKLEKLTEATRQKVYRDHQGDEIKEILEAGPKAPASSQIIGTLRAGDEMPAYLFKQYMEVKADGSS